MFYYFHITLNLTILCDLVLIEYTKRNSYYNSLQSVWRKFPV